MRRPSYPAHYLAALKERDEKKRSFNGASAAQVTRMLELADYCREHNDWNGATPGVLVALYMRCHEHVYGVFPDELRGKEFTLARNAAARLIDKDFGSNVPKMVAFMAWAWERERRAHVKSEGDRRRMGWRLQFSAVLVTDYRVSLARRKGTTR